MKAAVFLSTFLLCIDLIFCLWSGQPRVVTENGVVIGKHKLSHYGKKYLSFEGIPYAKPPVDDNRFKEPERLDNIWIGEWNATSPGSPCLQLDHYSRKRDENGKITYKIVGDEDCLFLNVYTQEAGPNYKDVIVMIHGGAFMFGNGFMYGSDYIMERDDIVYITFNYRLGPLGFLSTGDYFVPGNNGLKDQVAALEWVQRNIAAFGGDPAKVTIVGLSAGGASVHYHYLSHLSHGLFKRGYSYSGSALCPWALVTDGPQKTRQLATYLGCPTTDSRTIIKCLRRRPARKIVEQVKNFQTWLYNPYTVFGPVVEYGSNRPFIDQHPRDLLRMGRVRDLPWTAGVTSDEGLYPAAEFIEDDQLISQLHDNWRKIAPNLLFYNEQQGLNIAERVKQAYLGNEDINRATISQVVKLLGDRLFVAPVVETAILQARRNNQPVYLYMYRHRGERSITHFLSNSSNIHGTSHGDDAAYIIKFAGLNTHVTVNDKAMADILVSMLIAFCKTGRPLTSMRWEPVSKLSADSITYLNINGPNDMELRVDANIGNLKVILDIFGDGNWKRDEL